MLRARPIEISAATQCSPIRSQIESHGGPCAPFGANVMSFELIESTAVGKKSFVPIPRSTPTEMSRHTHAEPLRLQMKAVSLHPELQFKATAMRRRLTRSMTADGYHPLC
eukprot:Amastigsp_a844334_5.p6 type:complete len:110 gc:universal Amastigsp_a844334_5:2951-3280(+)